MRLLHKAAYLLIISFTFCLGACKTHYALVSAHRGKYPVDSTIAPDSGIIKTYLPYKQKMDAEMGRVIGTTDAELTKITGSPPETALGDFFADAVFQEAKKLDPTIDFGLPTTRGGLRNSLPKGNITLSNIFELMPFDNQLLVFKMKGDQVVALFNYIALTGGQPIANMRIKISGKQYTEVSINGKPFDPDRTYNVITSDYIASGW